MGRSVNYLNNAEVVIYFLTPESNNEDGEYDGFLSQLNWDDLVDNLTAKIKAKLPSYTIEKNKWGNNETRIILSNNLCDIGISEYCGLVSLSVAPLNNSYNISESLAIHHANQIEKTLQKIVDDLTGQRLNKIGTFSNGEAVFKLAK